jgi:hypothetical protein
MNRGIQSRQIGFSMFLIWKGVSKNFEPEHNILRLFAMELPEYSHNSDYILYKKVLSMTGNVK